MSIDDKTGKPTGQDGWKALVAAAELNAKGNELFEAATKNFVRMIEALLATLPPDHVVFWEEHYTQTAEGILTGGGKWVQQVFTTARANREREARA